MANKRIFVAFAIEDVSIRDMIKGQSLHTDSPFEYVDMSVKEAYDEEWKKIVQNILMVSFLKSCEGCRLAKAREALRVYEEYTLLLWD